MSEPSRQLVLVVDDEEIMLRFCERILGEEFVFFRAPDARAAREALAANRDLAGVLLDRDFSHAAPARLLGPAADARREGLHILRWLRDAHPDLPVVMVTGHRDQQAACEAAELRADYLVWEDIVEDPRILQARLRRALQDVTGETERALCAFHGCGVVGEAPAFRRALVALYRVVFDDNPILLLGETGTGKDLLAAAVHRLSRDHTRPFVNVNVAALAPSLIESELFGHEKGAYTDARSARPGKLRLAHGGTLFLNEIGDLALDLQAKLLTALEQREVVPVGGDRPHPAEFRLIAATSRDLRQLTESGRFRRDLYYRLAWTTVVIPPLRERREDIPRLVQHCLQRIAARGGGVTSMTREATEYLQSLGWEGNVRQLRAVVEAACASAEYVATVMDVTEVIARDSDRRGSVAAVPSAVPAASGSDREALEDQVFADLDFETLRRRYILCLLRLNGQNVLRVATIAGVGRTTIFEWLRRWRAAGEA